MRKGELPSQVADSLSSLDPGDIIAVPSGRHAGGSLSLTLAPTAREVNGLAPLS
ncbi:helicase [Cutibacterium acnes JCM 18918]|nr:helicase [Cutibacterium acnes JCM 18918]